MRKLLYGLILSRNAHLLPARMEGIRGAHVAVLAEGALAALAGDYDEASAPDLAALRAHDRVTQIAARAGATTIPVRFPQTFADEAALRENVARLAETYRPLLERLDGHAEMHLLMEVASDAAPKGQASTPGRAYLESLRGSGRVPGLTLRDALGPVVRDEIVSPLPKASGAVFCHLVLLRDESAYRDAVRSQPSLNEARIVGPLAIYSFAEER